MRRTRLITGAVVVVLALALFCASAGAATDNTWLGQSSASDNWSDQLNWSGLAPTDSESVGTLTFPDLGAGCDPTPITACYQSDNDLSSLSVGGLAFSGVYGYTMSGNQIGLGSGGLTDGGPGIDQLLLPIMLTAPQTWTLQDSAQVLPEAMSGSEALTVDVAGDAAFEPGNVEVGAVTLKGVGVLELRDGASLNSTDGSKTTIAGGGTFALDGGASAQTGPLSFAASAVFIGGVGASGTLTVHGAVSFTPDATLYAGIGSARSPAPIAALDFQQMTATGNVTLDGAKFELDQEPGRLDNCSPLVAGQSYPLILAKGTVAGTFAGIKNGQSVAITDGCGTGFQNLAATITYAKHSVVATIVATAPAKITAPQLKGAARVGAKLTASTGAWSGGPDYKYSWMRCAANGKQCTAIKGATRASFKLVKADADHRLKVHVTATNPLGSAKASTALSAKVTATKHKSKRGE